MSDVGILERPPIPQIEKTELSKKNLSPDPKQQSKIIGVILRNDPFLLAKNTVQLDPDEREKYLQFVAQGHIGDKQYSKLLENIKPPIATEKDQKNPLSLFSQISQDRQLRGIVAHFVRGNLQARDSLRASDVYSFARQKFPNPLIFEEASKKFLDQIEASKNSQKRAEYQAKIEALGSIIYGKQWEYLKQIRFLEEEAKTGQGLAFKALPELPQVRDLLSGLEQAKQFNREHRLKGRIKDGYKDGGRTSQFDDQGKVINPHREVIVVDRQRDKKLRQIIEKAKSIQAQYGTGMRAVFELTKLVYEKMHDPRGVNIVRKQLEASPGREILLGEITKENGLAGVCRHTSLLFQVLASEIGLSSNLVRGYARFSNFNQEGAHAWNEVEINGIQYLIDIVNPPGSQRFKSFDYRAFVNQGGFPQIDVNRSNNSYMDVKGVEMYRV